MFFPLESFFDNMDEIRNFQCQRCGNCCRVPGYVRLRNGEAERIAAYLELALHEFIDQYTCVTEDRTGLSLIENPDHSCIFLEEDGACRINDVKPKQCTTFPFDWRFSGWDKLCRGAILLWY